MDSGITSYYNTNLLTCVQVGKKNKTISTTTTEIQPSQIMRIFGGRYFTLYSINSTYIFRWKSILKSGSKESNSFEGFTTVALDITSSSISSVQDALISITEPETLDDFAAGGGDVHTTRQALFDQLPPVLILSLKRFLYDEVKGTVKLSKYITYPTELVIPPQVQAKQGSLDPSPKSYQLYAGNLSVLNELT